MLKLVKNDKKWPFWAFCLPPLKNLKNRGFEGGVGGVSWVPTGLFYPFLSNRVKSRRKSSRAPEGKFGLLGGFGPCFSQFWRHQIWQFTKFIQNFINFLKKISIFFHFFWKKFKKNQKKIGIFYWKIVKNWHPRKPRKGSGFV